MSNDETLRKLIFAGCTDICTEEFLIKPSQQNFKWLLSMCWRWITSCFRPKKFKIYWGWCNMLKITIFDISFRWPAISLPSASFLQWPQRMGWWHMCSISVSYYWLTNYPKTWWCNIYNNYFFLLMCLLPKWGSADVDWAQLGSSASSWGFSWIWLFNMGCV